MKIGSLEVYNLLKWHPKKIHRTGRILEIRCGKIGLDESGSS